MIFEIGKTYQHSTGKIMTIIGRLKTHFWGECLIGETYYGDLVPVGEQEDNSINWTEIEQLPLAKPQEFRWIPVNERLPEIGVDVLTQFSDYSMMVDCRIGSPSGWYWAEEDLPIAWMPLPEPYEAESEE